MVRIFLDAGKGECWVNDLSLPLLGVADSGAISRNSAARRPSIAAEGIFADWSKYVGVGRDERIGCCRSGWGYARGFITLNERLPSDTNIGDVV